MPAIFVSHAGSETGAAMAVKRGLEDAGADVILDTTEVGPGHRFVRFMNEALRRADYCLLLWSRAAEQRDWVEEEWQAALAWERALADRQVFLLVGRVEDYQLPPLLFARVFVDLFPELAPGLTRLTSIWQDDRRAEEATRKEVVPPKPLVDAGPTAVKPEETEVYVTSETFDCTVLLRVPLTGPAGAALHEVRERLGLPDRITVREAIGLSFSYALVYGDRVLRPEVALQEQGIEPGSVLMLQVAAEDFGQAAPDPSHRTRRVYRAAGPNSFLDHLRARGLRHD